MFKGKKMKNLAMVLVGIFTVGIVSTGFVTKTAPANSNLKPYVIQWYLPQSAQPGLQAVNDEINKITKASINATVKMNFIDWGSYDQKIQVMQAAGTPMDLIFTSNWTNDYVSNVNKGAYMEITKDMLTKYAPNILKQVPAKAWNAAKIKGKLYAIINTQVLARTPGIIMNKDYVDKYKFDLSKVKKLEDLTPLFEKIKKDSPELDPIMISPAKPILTDYASTMGLEMFSETNPAIVRINDSTSKVVNLYDTLEARKLFELLHKWYLSGIIRQDAPTYKDYTADESSGKTLGTLTVINPDSVANQAQLFGAKGDIKKITAVTFSKPYMSTSSIIATMTAISQTAKDPARDLMFYDLLYSNSKLFNLVSYGIEGKNYTKTGDVVKQIPNSGYWVASGWEYGNMFNSYRQDANQPEWYPVGPNLNNSANVSKILGFSLNPDPIKTELAQCQSAIDEFSSGLFTGAVDPNVVLPQLNAKLKSAGLDKVLAEIQKQINTWKKSK
jgi:putative aldouronate transport system substrate-binding protein